MKHKVSISNDRDMLRLRCSYKGIRKSMNVGREDTRSNRAFAEGIAREMSDDMRCGQFDPTLNKYRPKTIGNTGLLAAELFSKFAAYKQKHMEVSFRSIETRYRPIVSALTKWLNMSAHEVSVKHARNFISVQRERVSAQTTKERIWQLKSCCFRDDKACLPQYCWQF